MVTQIDHFTIAAVPLELRFNDTHLSQATGFIWKLEDRHYLITNWHVVSGQDFFTRKNLREDAGRPNKIDARFHIGNQFQQQLWTIIIRDENDRPAWLVHPGTRVDIVAIPFNPDPAKLIMGLYPFNVLANDPLRVEVGMDVFVLGYPFRIAPPAFPVWKRGSVASEPQIARMTGGYLLVDTASRPGMSGAPVILRSRGTHQMADGSTLADGAVRTRFLGVYSGRLPTEHPHEAQIGLVWDKSYIDEIIAGNIRDD